MHFRGGVPVGAKLLATTTALVLILAPAPGWAETLAGALARAYMANPDLNQQRAALRATDENLPRALSGWRPRITATADAGAQRTEQQSNAGIVAATTYPRGLGIQIDQNLYSGNRTVNSTRQAESSILAGREQLRNTEQTVLQNGVIYYMNVLRDTAILNLRRNNIEVLDEQLRQTRDRFSVGEVTRTDTAQAEAQLAGARADAFTAQSNLQTSIANYRQVIGVEPKSLAPAQSIEKVLPRTLDEAIAISQREHPLIQQILHSVDTAALAVKVVEGELLPTLGVRGSVQQRYDLSNVPGTQALSGSIVGTLTVPLYEGGEVYARVRQAKETLGQVRLQADLQRNAVRAAVVSNWGVLANSRAVIQSAQAQVQAAEIALSGVREEANVGQRTTLDVLNAQQMLLNARVSLVTAQRDRVVASYAVLSSIGRLSARRLGLKVATYDPTVHFDQVKGKWFGTSTPDGR